MGEIYMCLCLYDISAVIWKCWCKAVLVVVMFLLTFEILPSN